jgi:hypothetical protein
VWGAQHQWYHDEYVFSFGEVEGLSVQPFSVLCWSSLPGYYPFVRDWWCNPSACVWSHCWQSGAVSVVHIQVILHLADVSTVGWLLFVRGLAQDTLSPRHKVPRMLVNSRDFANPMMLC